MAKTKGVKYDPVIMPQVARWMARSGLTKEQIAFQLGPIAVSTFGRWMKKYPELGEAVKEGRDYADSLVEDALFKRAKGFTVELHEEKEGDKPFHKTLQKYFAPDTTAIIFWLKNRRADMWRDVRLIDMDFSNTDTDELMEEAKELVKLLEEAQKKEKA